MGLIMDAIPFHEPKPDQTVFDRRVGERAHASGTLQGVLANGRHMPWVMRLGLKNASQSGLCVTNDTPVETGSRISLRIDPVHGNWCTGVVVRCTERDGAYELGIAYEMRRAA
ncbi:MAG: PilZ domain-containing protein [Phycisphaerales bacterium]|nr:MAG: PilZ domain-containing protein [Phycisphaerales bacterium]